MNIAPPARYRVVIKFAVIPGEPFGADAFIRLSFTTSVGAINKGLDRIEEWANKNG